MSSGIALMAVAAEPHLGFAYGDESFQSGLLNNGAPTVLGIAFDAVDSVGRPLRYRWVRLNSTTPPSTPVVGPVYWKDNTFQVATANIAEAIGYGSSTEQGAFLAGILLNPNAVNGDFTVLQVGGYFGAGSDAGNQNGLLTLASVAKGDFLVSSTTSQSLAAVAVGTAPAYAVIGKAITASDTNNHFDIELLMQ